MTRKHIKWTDEEWDRLADFVFSMRLNNPEAAISNLYSRAIEQFPEDRRRPLQHAVTIKLSEMLLKRGQALKQVEDELNRLKTKLDTGLVAPKEDVLDNLSDFEVLRRFKDRVLNLVSQEDLLSRIDPQQLLSAMPFADLAAFAVKRFFTESAHVEKVLPVVRNAQPKQEAEKPAMNNMVPQTEKPQRLPRVALVGFKSQQAQEVMRRFSGRAECILMAQDLAKKTVPQSTDLIVHWARFSNHSTREKLKASGAKMIEIPDGGLEAVCTRLEKSLPR